jgi:hypothetical protein
MKTILQNLFAPTVESLTAPMQRIVKRLEEHADRNADRANQLHQQADDLRGVAHDCGAESLRSRAAADRMRKLLG